jgi:hypothetical protein
MKSVIIIPGDEKEFEKAFTLLTEFGEDSRPISLDKDDFTSFAFLKNVEGGGEKKPAKVDSKKTPRG